MEALFLPRIGQSHEGRVKKKKKREWMFPVNANRVRERERCGEEREGARGGAEVSPWLRLPWKPHLRQDTGGDVSVGDCVKVGGVTPTLIAGLGLGAAVRLRLLQRPRLAERTLAVGGPEKEREASRRCPFSIATRGGGSGGMMGDLGVAGGGGDVHRWRRGR